MGKIYYLMGKSSSGKDTLYKELKKRFPGLRQVILYTTRPIREGEQDGREYFFKTREEFEQMIAEGAFIEYAQYVENYYGTPKAYVEEQLANGKDVLLEIEIQGALQVKKLRPDALLIFITPPSAEILEQRLTGRGTETPEVIAMRMNRAVEEAAYMDAYDYIIINDQLEDCIEKTHRLIQSQHAASSLQSEFICRIQRELKERKESKA